MPPPFWLLAVWFALLTGFTDAAILLVQHLAFGEITGQSPDGVWLAPLAYTALFAPPALLLGIATSRASEPRRFAWRVGGLALCAWGSLVLFLAMRLHYASLAVLALGLALQTTRLAQRHRASFERLVRRTAPVLASLVLVLAMALPGYRRVAERRALASLPPAPAGAPNIIVLILDTVRARSLGLYGNPRPNTPSLERLAARGVLFERAITNAPWTLASHAVLFTGRPAHELRVGWEEPLDDRYPTLAEVLGARGYLTAGITANYFYTTWESGLERGFSHYDAQPVTPRQALKSTALGQVLEHLLFGFTLEERTSDRRSAGEINRAFLEWRRGAGPRPYFAFLNYIDAHLPYHPPEPFRSRFAADSSRRHAYRAAIAYADHEVGALVDSLAALGELRNTLLVVTSDHGELIGEHGLQGHTRGLYAPLLHVPLLIVPPGQESAGVRVRGAVQLANVPATVLEIALPGSGGLLPGRPLARRSTGREPGAELVLSEYGVGGEKSLWDGQTHYIRSGGGREQLFDVAADPDELHDLAARTPARVLAALRARLPGASASPQRSAAAGAH